MQSYIEIPSSETITNARAKILDNDKTIMSCNSGTAFPTADLQVGMLCYRTDLEKMFQLKDLTPTWELLIDHKTYVTTTATTEGWYRVATIPMTSKFKNATFRVNAYTATGTSTESTIMVNLAYYSGNYSSQNSSILCNTSHSYDSQTNSENGYVLLYCRVSFDATNAYIDLYKYKTTAVTIEINSITPCDWIWATGALTVNPTVGAYRNTSITMYRGLQGTNIVASSASYSTYSSYGVLGSQTLSNTTDKTGQWEYIGNWQFDYNASYLRGRSGNIRVRVQEASFDGSISPELMDDFSLIIRTNLVYHADSTAFNTAVPSISIEVEGRTSLNPATDICALIYSTSTTVKYIRFYIKLKSANTVYMVNPEQRYGRSFSTSSYSQTTSYCNFNLAEDQTPVAALPTPAQGSIVYASQRSAVMADALSTARKINGVDFDGTQDITITANANDVYAWAKESTKPSYTYSEVGAAASSHAHDYVVGNYTSNGGQQVPTYIGTNKVKFNMMNTTINGDSSYKDFIMMDCYSGSDVGGSVALGISRTSMKAFIMGSDAVRTSWARSAELITSANIGSQTVSTANNIPTSDVGGNIWIA